MDHATARLSSTGHGVQYLSLRYSQRLTDVGITSSVGRIGNSCDNARSETVISLFKTEVIRHHPGPWLHRAVVEFAAMDWVDWFNHRQLLEPIGDLPSAEAEANFHDTITESAQSA